MKLIFLLHLILGSLLEYFHIKFKIKLISQMEISPAFNDLTNHELLFLFSNYKIKIYNIEINDFFFNPPPESILLFPSNPPAPPCCSIS